MLDKEEDEDVPPEKADELAVEEEKHPKKALQNKKKGNIITSIYSRGLITRNITLSITNIGKNIKERLKNQLHLILKVNV